MPNRKLLGLLVFVVLLLIATCLTGCGGSENGFQLGVAHRQTPYRYTGTCGIQVFSEVELKYPRRLEQHMEGAMEEYDKRFGVGALCDDIQGVTLTVLNGDFSCPFDGDETVCEGFYGPTTGIILDGYSFAFLHETIHLYEARHGMWDTGTHAHWVDKGYSSPGREDWGDLLDADLHRASAGMSILPKLNKY